MSASSGGIWKAFEIPKILKIGRLAWYSFFSRFGNLILASSVHFDRREFPSRDNKLGS